MTSFKTCKYTITEVVQIEGDLTKINMRLESTKKWNTINKRCNSFAKERGKNGKKEKRNRCCESDKRIRI